MGQLIVSVFMTVDGVMVAPGFEEHRSGRNGWALRLTDDEMREWSDDLIQSAEAVLLGRTTYQIWAAFWPALRDDEPLGRQMNEVPKYVVSNSLTRVDWMNSTIAAATSPRRSPRSRNGSTATSSCTEARTSSPAS